MESICTICERTFNRSLSYRPTCCLSCDPLKQAGMSPEEICLQRADKTRSKAEHQRLILVAQKHRLNQEEFAKVNGIDQRRNNELRSLRSGLKEKRGRDGKKEWLCSRCRRTYEVKRCLACELEIARS
jgi:hypothetical protein